MGWNIFYKECKYLAAHRILRILNRESSTYALGNYGEITDNNDIEPSPYWVSLKSLTKEARIFPIHMVKDAVFMMHNVSQDIFSKEVDLLNSDRISEIKTRILWKGKTALKDRKYIRMFVKSGKVIVPLIIAILSGIIGLIRCLI